MKMRKALLLAIVLIPQLVSAKTADGDARLNQKLAAESEVNDRLDLRAEINQPFNEIHGLNEATRAKLVDLREHTVNQERAMATQVLRLKAVLIKDLLSDEYDKAEVRLIQRRMHAISEKRLGLLFAAVGDAHKILGQSAKEHKEIFDDYFKPDLAAQP